MTNTEVQTTEAQDYEVKALGPDLPKYQDLVARLLDLDIPEFKVYREFVIRINAEKAKVEAEPKKVEFYGVAKELKGMGIKLSDVVAELKNVFGVDKKEFALILPMLKGEAKAKAGEFVAAVFPEIKIAGPDGKEVPFEWKANKKYTGRGVEADAIRKLKAKGEAYFVKHLNEAGQEWYTKPEKMKRGDKLAYRNKAYINKMFAGAVVPTPTPEPAPKEEVKPAAAPAKAAGKVK